MSELEPQELTTSSIEALRGLQLSPIQRMAVLHLIYLGRPATFSDLLAITGNTPEAFAASMRELYKQGYVPKLSPRGTTDPIFEFIARPANRADVKAQTPKGCGDGGPH